MRTAALLLLIITIFISSSAYSEQKSTGIGLISGEPTGVSFKFHQSRNTAIAGAIAWSFVDDSSLHVHADWLTHNWTYLKDTFEVKSGELPLYYGIGGRVLFDDDTRLGARFVIGMSYIFEDAPFDLFLEAAPVLDVIPKTTVGFNSAIGVRYWID